MKGKAQGNHKEYFLKNDSKNRYDLKFFISYDFITIRKDKLEQFFQLNFKFLRSFERIRYFLIKLILYIS